MTQNNCYICCLQINFNILLKLTQVRSLFSGERALMRKYMPHFGQNMLFMDKVLNSETQNVARINSELMLGIIILAVDKDFLHCLQAQQLASRCIFEK